MSRKQRRRYYRREYSQTVRGDTPVNLDVLWKMGGAVFAIVIVVVSAIIGFARRILGHRTAPNQSSIPSTFAFPHRPPSDPILSGPGTRERIHGELPRPSETESPMPYKSASGLLSKGERAFWYPFYRAAKGKYRVFCKVRLADIVIPEKVWGRQRLFKRIGHFHVDFVLCEPRTTAPLLVVELDDRSHLRLGRKGRDQFKDKVLAAAGLPVYRVKCQSAYDVAEIAENIERLMTTTPK